MASDGIGEDARATRRRIVPPPARSYMMAMTDPRTRDIAPWNAVRAECRLDASAVGIEAMPFKGSTDADHTPPLGD